MPRDVVGVRALTTTRPSLVVAAALLVVMSGCSSSTPDPASRPVGDVHELTAADRENTLLFVARSPRGTLTVDGDGQGVLELDEAATMTWFTDRPAHDAGATTAADALEALGWTGNGSPIGDEPPNAALIAAELGDDTPIVELLTATIDGERIRFDIEVVGAGRPESGALTAVELFIDDATLDGVQAGGAPTGLERNADGIVLSAANEDPQTPPLTLDLADDIVDQLLSQDRLFAVISGADTSTSAGAVVIPAGSASGSGGASWRFTVDPTLVGDDAPMVVITSTDQSVAELALQPRSWSSPAALNDDVGAASTRLSAIVATVEDRVTDDPAYADLHAKLTDPTWNGVLVFNASVVVPDEVQGTPTGGLAGTTIPAVALGSTTSPLTAGASGSPGPAFGLIDHPAGIAGQASTSGPSLRAVFANAQMSFFDLTAD